MNHGLSAGKTRIAHSGSTSVIVQIAAAALLLCFAVSLNACGIKAPNPLRGTPLQLWGGDDENGASGKAGDKKKEKAPGHVAERPASPSNAESCKVDQSKGALDPKGEELFAKMTEAVDALEEEEKDKLNGRRIKELLGAFTKTIGIEEDGKKLELTEEQIRSLALNLVNRSNAAGNSASASGPSTAIAADGATHLTGRISPVAIDAPTLTAEIPEVSQEEGQNAPEAMAGADPDQDKTKDKGKGQPKPGDPKANAKFHKSAVALVAYQKMIEYALDEKGFSLKGKDVFEAGRKFLEGPGAKSPDIAYVAIKKAHATFKTANQGDTQKANLFVGEVLKKDGYPALLVWLKTYEEKLDFDLATPEQALEAANKAACVPAETPKAEGGEGSAQ